MLQTPGALRTMLCLTVSMVAIGALGAPAPAGAAQDFEHNPVIFVHGFFGSGAQFESQKMRLVSNGYPESYVTVLEYDSLFGTESREEVLNRLDRLVAALSERTGKARVDILGHSLGTSVMQEYLTSSPERAGNVGNYVNIDGREAGAPPGGVRTLAIWAGRGEPGRKIDGAQNVTLPNQTHVQSATSSEAFSAFYEFFTGAEPATSEIAREDGNVKIEGRAVLFPQNRSATATAVEVWPISSETGQRTSARPIATAPLGPDGGFGPVEVETGRHYEMSLVRPGVAALHYYFEPFVRDDHLVRLLYSEAVESLIERGESHVAGLVIRNKELWGDQGAQNDVLSFNGTNVCAPVICPLDKRVIGLFAFDRGSDRRTDLSAPNPVFSSLSFLTGADVFMPASRPPAGTTTVSLKSRGGGPARTLRLPNFASTLDGFSIYFNDFEQTVTCLDASGSARGRRLGPARLARRPAQQRRLLGSATRLGDRPRVDRYCATGGGSYRVGYPTARLSRRQRALAKGRSVLLLASSGRLAVRGIRAGSTVKSLRRRLGDERRYRVGKNVWFVAQGKRTAFVFKMRAGQVQELGIADARLTRGQRATRRLLGSWRIVVSPPSAK